GDPLRREALRWLVFLVAAVYATFTYGDEPPKWTPSGARELRESTLAHRQTLWRQLDGGGKGPGFLGPRVSMLALDICGIAGGGWCEGNGRKRPAMARGLDGDPRRAALWPANFE